MAYSRSDDPLADIFTKLFDTTQATGSVVISGTLDKITFKKSYGKVHLKSNTPVTFDTLFDVQSITKQIATASLLEELIGLKKLNLTDPVSKFISEFESDDKKNITIYDLLQHKAGISEEDFQGIYNSANDLWTAMQNSPIKKGTKVSVEYSDVGYRLLGKCLEVAGNGNLNSLSEKFVWLPLEMKDTTYEVGKYDLHSIAGNGTSWGTVDDEQDRFLGQPLGCDGVFSSANDLEIFCKH